MVAQRNPGRNRLRAHGDAGDGKDVTVIQYYRLQQALLLALDVIKPVLSVFVVELRQRQRDHNIHTLRRKPTGQWRMVDRNGVERAVLLFNVAGGECIGRNEVKRVLLLTRSVVKLLTAAKCG